ncbi:hypothetical protein BH10ACI2_BH10ACI2_14470 [soil metagenome]
MNNIIRNILAVIVGVVIGGIANMAIVMIGPMVIPPPPGADMTTVEGLTAAMHLLEPKHFISPFLAHAIGTLVGALAASFIAGSKRLVMALIVGAFFLLGGITASYLIPAPLWFKAVDIILAYIPMAWLGWKLSGRK